MSTTPTGFIGLFTRLRVENAKWTRLLTQFGCDLRVAIPAVVVSFDATKQTITAQPAIRENVLLNGVLTAVDLPVLVDIPIVMPRAGGYSLTMPITAGDECLLIFSDMCIDAWYQNSNTDNIQVDKRRHDLSDAIAIVGCWSQPNVLATYSTNSVQLKSDDDKRVVEIAGAAINITVTDASPINITSGTGKVAIASSTEIDITAPTIKLNGAVSMNSTLGVTGATTLAALTTNGTTTLQSKSWLSHLHTGVTTGGGDTGPVA